MASISERTFIAIKPDGVQRHLVGEIVRRFERKGFKLVGLKLLQVRGPGGALGAPRDAGGAPWPSQEAAEPCVVCRPRRSC